MNMQNKVVLLYGANGFTGQLIITELLALGINPVLGGRNKAELEILAEKHQLDFRIFSLDTFDKIKAGIENCFLVIHAAGPFKYTAQQMIEACMDQGVHYMDITGEVDVFEFAASQNDIATQKGLCIMPGTGFDVVPTDCAAKFLIEQLPDATHLQLGFTTIGGLISRGTSLTMLESMDQKGMVREEGKLTEKPVGHKTMLIPFKEGKSLFSMTIPWGDISTAYRTTGIPNIETFTAIPPKTYDFLKWRKLFNPLLKLNFVKSIIRKKILSRPPGPDEQMRNKARSYVWGKVWNKQGDTQTVNLDLPEAYALTAKTTALIAKKMVEGQVFQGYQTPAGAYGADLILEIESSKRIPGKS